MIRRWSILNRFYSQTGACLTEAPAQRGRAFNLSTRPNATCRRGLTLKPWPEVGGEKLMTILGIRRFSPIIDLAQYRQFDLMQKKMKTPSEII
jgi:hypothetical protein